LCVGAAVAFKRLECCRAAFRKEAVKILFFMHVVATLPSYKSSASNPIRSHRLFSIRFTMLLLHHLH
jgi:hypothetical protein